MIDLTPDPGVDTEPGQEVRRVRRPAVIITNEGANETARRLGHGSVTVVPVSPDVERVYPFQIRLRGDWAGLECDHKAQLEQIRCIDVARVGEPVGVVPVAVMFELNDALKLHLGL